MTTWIGIGLSIACLFAAEAALAAPQVGPRDAVEAAVGRFMTIVQNGRPDAAIGANRLGEIRQIVREMFDFDEISRRALSRHWQTLQREEQAEFVTLFRDLLERAYLTQMEAAGGEKITFLSEAMEPGRARIGVARGEDQGQIGPIGAVRDASSAASSAVDPVASPAPSAITSGL
jgi:ABC-type transporter MlaC component